MESFVHMITQHNISIIQWLTVFIVVTFSFWLRHAFKYSLSKKEGNDSESSTLHSPSELHQLEETLKKVIQQVGPSGQHAGVPGSSGAAPSGAGQPETGQPEAGQPGTAQPGTAQPGTAQSGANPAGGAPTGGPHSTGSLDYSNNADPSNPMGTGNENNAGAGARDGINTAAADNTKLKEKIDHLEARLMEYEIIEDDIADLSTFKEENQKLKELVAHFQEGAKDENQESGVPSPATSAPPEEVMEAASKVTSETSNELDSDSLAELLRETQTTTPADMDTSTEAPTPDAPSPTENKLTTSKNENNDNSNDVALTAKMAAEAFNDSNLNDEGSSELPTEASLDGTNDDSHSQTTSDEIDPFQAITNALKPETSPLTEPSVLDPEPSLSDWEDATAIDSAETSAETSSEKDTEKESVTLSVVGDPAEEHDDILSEFSSAEQLEPQNPENENQNSMDTSTSKSKKGKSEEGMAFDTDKMLSEVSDLEELKEAAKSEGIDEQLDMDKMSNEASGLLRKS